MFSIFSKSKPIKREPLYIQGGIQLPPKPKEVTKIQMLLSQAEYWMNKAETELAASHWHLISNECSKIANSLETVSKPEDDFLPVNDARARLKDIEDILK